MNQNESEAGIIRKIIDATVFDAVDVAVLQVGVSFGKKFGWSTKRPALLDQVRAFGYPFGFDIESETLTVRAFQGETVGGRNMHRLSGLPAAFELSFPCARGLSGAPLFSREKPNEIVGVVLGNEITEITVFTGLTGILDVRTRYGTQKRRNDSASASLPFRPRMTGGAFMYVVILALLAVVLVTPAHAQVYVDIGIHLPAPPRLVIVPEVRAVQYVPAAPANLFFYSNQYWAFANGGWHVSVGFNGPWIVVAPQFVPRPVLLVPVNYYRVPPGHWKQWQKQQPPRWGNEWGREWADKREWKERGHERDDDRDRGEGKGHGKGRGRGK